MSIVILMDRAIYTALGRGQEPDVFLAGKGTMRELERLANSMSALAGRAAPLGRTHYRGVALVPLDHMDPAGLELVARPHGGAPEVVRLR